MRCAGPVLFGLLAGSNSLAADRQAMAEEVFKNIQMFKGKPAARVGDVTQCAGPPGTVAPPGWPSVLIGGA